MANIIMAENHEVTFQRLGGDPCQGVSYKRSHISSLRVDNTRTGQHRQLVTHSTKRSEVKNFVLILVILTIYSTLLESYMKMTSFDSDQSRAQKIFAKPLRNLVRTLVQPLLTNFIVIFYSQQFLF